MDWISEGMGRDSVEEEKEELGLQDCPEDRACQYFWEKRVLEFSYQGGNGKHWKLAKDGMMVATLHR